MIEAIKFFGRIATSCGLLGCTWIFLGYFSGTSGCSWPHVFEGCSSAWFGASPLVVGILLGIVCLIWAFRGGKRGQAIASAAGFVYALAIYLLFLGYVSVMAGLMH